VPLKQGDEEPKEHNNEERQASDPRNMPSVWHQDVPNWEELATSASQERLDVHRMRAIQPFFLPWS
jgi:hypothetical protein